MVLRQQALIMAWTADSGVGTLRLFHGSGELEGMVQMVGGSVAPVGAATGEDGLEAVGRPSSRTAGLQPLEAVSQSRPRAPRHLPIASLEEGRPALEPLRPRLVRRRIERALDPDLCACAVVTQGLRHGGELESYPWTRLLRPEPLGMLQRSPTVPDRIIRVAWLKDVLRAYGGMVCAPPVAVGGPLV